MKNLNLSTIFVLAALMMFRAETSFAQTGSSPQKSQPQKILRPSKQKQARIKGRTNRQNYRYIVLINSSTKRKYRGKMDLSKVPRVVALKEIH